MTKSWRRWSRFEFRKPRWRPGNRRWRSRMKALIPVRSETGDPARRHALQPSALESPNSEGSESVRCMQYSPRRKIVDGVRLIFGFTYFDNGRTIYRLRAPTKVTPLPRGCCFQDEGTRRVSNRPGHAGPARDVARRALSAGRADPGSPPGGGTGCLAYPSSPGSGAVSA